MLIMFEPTRIWSFLIKLIFLGTVTFQSRTIVTTMHESVTLFGISRYESLRGTYRFVWHYNGGSEIVNWRNNLSPTIQNVSLEDAGIYEVYLDTEITGRYRYAAYHTLIRLIVRGKKKIGDLPQNELSKFPPLVSG